MYWGAGLLFLAVSMPLARRRIPMNHWYGFRIRAAFESQDRWYAVNEYGGRLMARWSFLLIVVGAAGWLVPKEWVLAYAIIAIVTLCLSAIVPAIMVVARERPSRPH